MRKAYSGFYLCSIILLMAVFVNIGCDDGGGGGVPSTGGGVQPGVAEKQMIIEGPIPNEIAEKTSVPVPGAPSGVDRAVEFGDSKEFTIAVIDRDDPAMSKELAPVVIESSENTLYKYKYRAVINIENGRKTPFIAIKSKILNKVVLSSIPGQVPSYGEVPAGVKKIYIKGVLVNSESTARAVLANDNKMEIGVPVITLSSGEQSQEVVVRVLGSGDKLPADTVIENKAGGVSVVSEMAKAVDAIKTVLVTTELTAAEKSAVFENTREKLVVPSAAGVISDYVLTLKNIKIQQKASELNIPSSITLGGTKIDGRSTVAVIDGGTGNIAGAGDNEPPSVTSVTITPKTVKVGDELQLAFTTSKLLILPPVVIINDRTVEAVKIDTNTYKAVTSVLGSDPKEVTFKIDNLVGENGKTAQPVTETTDKSKPKVEEGVTAVHPPVFDPPTGIYKSAKIVAIYSKTPGCDIYYTLDGSEPSAAYGSRYESPVTVGTDTTIKAVAVFNGELSIVNQASYVISLPVASVEAPVFSFAGGSFSKSQSVAISSATPGASIKYTLDGSTPSKTNGALYSTAVLIDKQMVLKAVAIKDGMRDSAVTSAVYDVNVAKETAPAPAFNPAPGAFISKRSVAIVSAVEGARIKYTLDGSEPSYDNGFVYSEPVVVMEPVTIKAVAMKDGMNDSAVASGLFDVNIVGPVLEPVAPPVFSPQEGRYTNYNEFKVKIITPFKDAKIIYTTDGTTPGADNGEIYSGPVLINKSTAFKAVALKDKMLDSEVVSAFYEIRNDNAPPAPPVISGIKDGAITPYEVSLAWNEQEGVESFAAILKDGARSDYSKGSPISEEGSYTLEVGVRKTANNKANKAAVSFVIDKSLPVVPAVIGIGTNEISAKPVIFFWQDALWTKTTAKLDKEGGLKSDYSKGYEITDNGSYILEITSVNEKNGLVAHDSLPFKIDSLVPEVPAIAGIVDNSHNASAVAADWEDIEGVTLTAELSKNGGEAIAYERKTAISEEGAYTLKLTARKNDTGTLNSRSVSFVIDKSEPAAPVVSGVKDGAITSADIRVTWEEAGGNNAPAYGPVREIKTIYRAEISKDGGKAEKYLKNSVISAPGAYAVTVTAIKPNRLKKETIIKFTIDKDPPAAPFINVSDEGGASVVSWEEEAGVEYVAKIIKDGGEAADYIMKTPVTEKGVYTITVTAKRKDTGVSISSKANFNRLFSGLVVGPKAVEIIGIDNNAVTGNNVKLNWTVADGTTATAAISKNGGQPVSYEKGAAITEEGVYTVVVEVIDSFTKLSSKSFVNFTIDKTAPLQPVISGINEGAITASEVKLSWNEQAGVETYARIYRNLSVISANAGEVYEKNSAMKEDGAYTAEVFAKKISNGLVVSSLLSFTIDTAAPAAPEISGIDNKTVTARAVALSWKEINGVEYTAKLFKNQGAALLYVKNSEITEEGSYAFEVTAKKLSNGLSSVSALSFVIDKSVPEIPELFGVKDGGVYSKAEPVSWVVKKEGDYASAVISQDGGPAETFLKGSVVNGDGSYALKLTVKNETTGVENSKIFKFKVDGREPDAPVISGVKEGSVNAGAVYLSWNEVSGVEYSAVITPEGGKSYPYLKGAAIAADGKYDVKVSAKKNNGLVKESVVGFEIDGAAPAVPIVKYVDKGGGVSVLDWPDTPGVKVSAKIILSKTVEYEYIKNTPITLQNDEAIRFSLVITAVKERNGLSSSATLYFNRTPAGFDAGPDYPIISGVDNGGYYSGPVSASWESVSGVSYQAVLKKDGGEPVLYSKNSEISGDGSYVLEVSAEKNVNGLKNKAAVSFKIDSAPPAKPVITGLEDQRYFYKRYNIGFNGRILNLGNIQITRDVVLSWQEEQGVYYSAVITKDGGSPIGYGRGSVISESGSYKVEVTALKLANKKSVSESVSFVIDKNAPEPPVISGVENGAVTPSDVTLNWKAGGDGSGILLEAFLAKNGGEPAAVQNGAILSENGEYTLEVKAIRTVNNSSSKTAVSFKIDKNVPAAPVISGISDGAFTAEAVKLSWNEQEGVVTTAQLSKDGVSLDYSKGAAINETGEYTFEARAVKTANGLSNSAGVKFTIDRTQPDKPVIKGAGEGEVTAGPVKLYWNDQKWTEFSAKISKNNGLKAEYVSGYELSEEGVYALEVTAKNTRSGLTAVSTLNFTIDAKLPGLPEITGISEGGVSGSGVKLFWEAIEGVTLTAKLNKNGGTAVDYQKGTVIAEDGSYVFELTAKKNATGVTASKTLKFTIDKGLPSAPVITGVTEGAVAASPVKLSWQELSGVEYSAVISKDGGSPEAYSKNSAVAENGKYVLSVTAVGPNGLSAKSSLAFVIDMTAPEVPVVSVKDEDDKSYVSWIELDGVKYTAKISKDGGSEADYVMGSPVSEKGAYVVSVTAKRLANGLETKTSVAFNRQMMRILVAPEAPQVRGVEDGSVAGSDVSLTWNDVTSVLTYGRLKKDNGEFKDYTKGAAITEDGGYIFELEAKEPKTQMSSKRTISFIIDKKAPAAPVISGVKDGEAAGGELKLSWNEQDGCETTARITKSGAVTTVQTKTEQSGNGQNQDVLEIIYRLMMNNDYYHLYEYSHEYNLNSDHFDMAIRPLLDKNRMLAKQLRYYYEQQLQGAMQTTSTTTSTQSYIESAYEKNSSIIENGEYILEVTALKKYNGLKAVSRVKFILDQNEPAVPIITGIDNDAVTSENVTIKWEKSEGVSYLAKLLKDGDTTLLYESGSPITLAGSYYLEVTATNKSNGKTSSASRKFKIDRSVPAIPELIGAKDGDYKAKDITISWQDASGHSSSAVYSIDGSKETAYKKGDTLSAEGYYKFKITVKNSVSGISNSKTIGFTIDRKAPEVPEFAGFTNGAVYSGPVSISWFENQDITYKATITRNNDANGEYSKGAIITDDGSYSFTLSAVKLNDLSNSTTAVFIIDKTSPAAPVIDLVNKTSQQQPSAPSYGGAIVEKSPLNGPTVISWNEQQGCETTATLSKNGGAAAAYLKNTEISEDGKYVIEVTAKKRSNGLSSKATMRFSRMPDGFYSGPAAPKISGALEGSVNAKAVTLSWPEEDGVAYYATLSKDGGDPMEISNGTVVSKNGKYSLEVKAEKKSNGLANRSTLSFTLDTLPPDMPLISGVRAEAVYASGVKASWKEAPGTFYSAYLTKDDEPESVSYGNGFPITQDGRYKLVVQAVKMSNNLDSKTELGFTIDQTPPDAPVISGVEDGAVIPEGVKLEWKEVSGVKTTALISKDGGNPMQFSNGGSISINGSYRLEVTAFKTSNGLKSASVINFTINTEAPAKPVVSGVAAGRGYTTPVSASWEDQAGEVIKALLYAPGASDPVDYVKGTPITYNGKNRLVVTARSANGLTNETDITFMIDTVPPQAPALSVISKDEGVYVGWNETNTATYSARLSKKGGQPEHYLKGALITEDGEYTLELIATAVYEGAFEFASPLKANASITFTKSGAQAISGPAAPVISGASNGAYYNKPVSLSWEEVSGAKTSALLTKFGNTPAAYEKGSSISVDGSYVLEVNAVSDSNKMSSKSSVAFVIDTTRPAVSLSYSANPAGEGLMRITAAFTEVLAEGSAVKINIDQPGSEDIKNASMTRDQSSPAVWYYDYYVNAADGSKYIDGVASLSLSEVFDPVGNIAQAPSNASFVINTSSPVSSITYSFVPAVPDPVETQSPTRNAPLRLRGSENSDQSNVFRQGKLTITVIFSKDVKNGLIPKIYIDQPGSEDIKDKPMEPGNNRRVWTYEYAVNADNGSAYIDGNTTVSISQTADEFGKIFAQPANRYFTIDTKAPSVELLYSANPARPGKLTITAKYSEPPMSGYIPRITIFQQGSYELADAAMRQGSSSSVWTYDYYIKGDESGEFADGRAVVVLSSVTDAAGNISKRPYNQTFLVGTKIPNYAKLSFSANPAGAGKMRITASFNEDYAGAKGPRISIDQQGKADVQQKWMEPGADKKTWYYDYVINDNNGSDFMDGDATVGLIDEKGSALDIVDGNIFVIDTTPPVVQLLSLTDAGIKIAGGSDYTIKWSASDSEGMPEKPVSISFYNGLNWATVEAGLENSGSYVWKVPLLDIATAKISVSAVDKVGNRASAASANAFTIVSSGPAWSAGYPKAEMASLTSVKLTLKANRSGKAYYMFIPASANIENVPSDNVKSGVLEGVTVSVSGAKDITSDTELSFDVEGLSEGAAYSVFIVVQDTLGIMQKSPAALKVELKKAPKFIGVGGDGMDNSVYKVLTDGKGNLYTAGSFKKVGIDLYEGQTVYKSDVGVDTGRIAKWDGSKWSPLGSGILKYPYITEMALDSKGNLYIGGSFKEINGVKAFGVAKWDGSKWSALGDSLWYDDVNKAGIQRSSSIGYVYSIAIDSKDNVYVGGSFTLAGQDGNDILANYIAKWDGSKWSALGDGALYKSTIAPYKISGNTVQDIVIDKNDNIYMCGSFNYAGGSENGKYIAKWDGSKWNALGAGLDAAATTLALDSIGNLYVGGNFKKAGDVSVNYVAKWNGSTWSALGDGFNSVPSVLFVNSKDVLYAGGGFKESGAPDPDVVVDPKYGSLGRMAKWNGSKWVSTGVVFNDSVLSIAEDIDGGIFAGGYFNKVNEQYFFYLIKINP